MPIAHAVVANHFQFKMAQIIIHNNATIEQINEQRLIEDFNLSYSERVSKAFKLMRLGLMFSQQDKSTFKKRIIIKQ